jgi:hypothetical protein
MEQTMTQLAAIYGVDLTQPGATFILDTPQPIKRWLIANLDGQRICITHSSIEADDLIAPDLAMIFVITPAGWEPIEVMHTPATWEPFAQVAGIPNMSASTEPDKLNLAHFTEYWARQIEQQSGLEPAYQTKKQTLWQHSHAENDMTVAQHLPINAPSTTELSLNQENAEDELRTLQKEAFRLWYGDSSNEELEKLLQFTFDPMHWQEKSPTERQARKEKLTQYITALTETEKHLNEDID